MKPEIASKHLYFSVSEQKHLGYSVGDNHLNASSLHQYYAPVNSSGFAIKFVKSGLEHYRIENELFDIGPGSYLLLTGSKTGSVEIDGSENTHGICVNVSRSLIEEVVTFRRNPDSSFSDPDLSEFLFSEEGTGNFFECNNEVGKLLQSISVRIETESLSKDDINSEIFMDLAEALVSDQMKCYKQLQDIPVLKYSAKKDIYRRVQRGRELIDRQFCSDISAEDIAQHATMSQFHFSRIFKSIYSQSPYQYILNKRLDLAKRMLCDKESVSTIALETGFSDVYSFSKAFKKKYGLSPTQMAANKIAGFDK
jgi:AraC family transcriptional regulator